jgi:hypothetical protein
MRKTTRYLRIIAVSAEVRTQHLLNTSIERYHHTCLLSTDFIGMVVMMMIFVRAREISPSRVVAQTIITDGKVVLGMETR